MVGGGGWFVMVDTLCWWLVVIGSKSWVRSCCVAGVVIKTSERCLPLGFWALPSTFAK